MTKGASVITMTYTADGEKLSKAVTGGGATKNYVGGIEYAGANLEAIYFGEGRCTPNGATAFNYDYTVKDHLGNARVNFRANGTAITVLESMHYYPFGMLMEGIGTNTPTNDYTYNSKELNEDFGLNLYDYGARWYDASLGRWWSVDLLAEKYFWMTPYCYAANSPILIIDPNGMDLYIKNNENSLQAMQDLQEIANKIKYGDSVKFTFSEVEGGPDDVRKVDVEFSGLTASEIEKDAGLKLLSDITSSDKKYLYEVADNFKGVDRDSGKETENYSLGSKTAGGSLALNLSTTGRGDSPRDESDKAKSAFQKFNSLPANGYDAHIIVARLAGDATYTDSKGEEQPLNRTWFAFHELQEAYNRTDKKEPYKTAHNNAMETGKNYYLTPKGWDQRPTNPYRLPPHYRKSK